MSPSRSRLSRWAIATTAAVSCLCGAAVAKADYVYASTSGFSGLTTNNPVQFALTDGSTQFNTLTITRLTDLSSGMSQATTSISFSADPPYSNPAWVAGTRSLFRIRLDTTVGTVGTVSYELSFATPIPPSSYLVFVDFDLRESVNIKAYDASDNLIPYASISFSRQNGESTTGASVPSSFDPLAGYTGRLSTTQSSARDDPVISLSSSVPIKRLVYDWTFNPNALTNYDTHTRFNVAVLTYYVDADRDGYGDGAAVGLASDPGDGYSTDDSDCDDTNADIYPGNPEICDGYDNDCVGGIDNGLTFLDYYADTDSDGYGDPLDTPTSSCSAVTDEVTNALDCDDTNDDMYPGNPEICDGYDNDCVGGIDNGLAFTDYYADTDSDGYGDPLDTPTSSCSAVTGDLRRRFRIVPAL